MAGTARTVSAITRMNITGMGTDSLYAMLRSLSEGLENCLTGDDAAYADDLMSLICAELAERDNDV